MDNFLSSMAVKYAPQIDWSKYYPEEFIYSIPFNGVTGTSAGSQYTGSLNISSDASFIVTEICRAFRTEPDFSTLTGAGSLLYEPNTAAPNMFLQMVDSGAGKSLFDNPISVNSIFNPNTGTWKLAAPRILGANTSLQTTLISYDTVNTWNVQLAFKGVKIYPRVGIIDPTPNESQLKQIARSLLILAGG